MKKYFAWPRSLVVPNKTKHSKINDDDDKVAVFFTITIGLIITTIRLNNDYAFSSRLLLLYLFVIFLSFYFDTMDTIHIF